MSEEGGAVFVVFLVGIVIGCFVGGAFISDEWEHVTIGRGLALYCPDNGNWAWKGECEE